MCHWIPTIPSERLSFMFQDTQMPIVLTHQHLVARLPEHHPQVICLDTDRQTIRQWSTSNTVCEVKGEHLAYVIYTSGSTGQPKGVLIEHRAITAHCWTVTQVYGLVAEDRVLQFSTFTFDPSLEQILSTLSVGARLVMRGEEVWSPADLLQKVRDAGLTVINLPPAYWHHMLREWAHNSQQLLDHRLRLVIVGGDRLPIEALQLWWNMPFKSVRLLNAYGPTETTITTTIFDTTSHIDREQLLIQVPIGRPIDNRQCYVLGAHLQPVPIGVPGELYIGGIGLARGYLNRPQLSCERFINHSFCDEPGTRLYKTGDLVRYRSDGILEFLGRVDQQIKIRGFRIEPGEIEAVLCQHPLVWQALVMAVDDGIDDRRLLAYVVLHSGQVVTLDALREHVSKHLPSYMQPAAIVLLESLPLMSNGKVDRRLLPVPEPTRQNARSEYVAPSQGVQQQLVQLWEELLQVHPIGIHDNFFELGGHSLLALRLLDRMAHLLGKRLAPSTLMTKATIEELSLALTQPGEAPQKAPLVAVQPAGSRRPFFFLHGQWNGGGYYSLELARALGQDQPFYLLEPYDLRSGEVPPSFETIAFAHLQMLRQVQREGPYLLGGWCNGGLMAYEMARQLQAQGQQVALLVLMDPDAPGLWHRERKSMSALGNLLRVRPERPFEWFCRYRQWRLSFHHWRLQSLSGSRERKKAEQPVGGLRAESEERVDDWLKLYEWMAAGYKPASYEGKLTLFWTQQEPWRRESWCKVMGRQTLASEVNVHFIPGDHISSRTQYLPLLAEQLALCINQAQSHFSYR